MVHKLLIIEAGELVHGGLLYSPLLLRFEIFLRYSEKIFSE